MTINVIRGSWLAHLIVAISIGACGGASGPSDAPMSKLDAEELGYTRQFADVGLRDRCKALLENAYDQNKYGALDYKERLAIAQNEYGAHMEALRAIARKHASRLQVALAPDAFREMHDARLRFLIFAQTAADSSMKTAAEQFFEQCKIYHEVGGRLDDSIASRTESYSTTGTVKLSYQPPLLPVSFHHDGTFTVKSGISTPIGDFSVGYTNSAGVKLLIVRSEGRERYFALARPFELYLPAAYGVNVKGDGNTTLIIEVVQR